jgi:hypothetical protein
MVQTSPFASPVTIFRQASMNRLMNFVIPLLFAQRWLTSDADIFPPLTTR